MEWSIHEITRLTGTTSRTLRHYGQIGLLEPSRTGHSGLRYYDEDALVRLQRILLLRRLGLSLPAIADVLAGTQDVVDALRTHLGLLEQERDRVQRQIDSLRRTIEKKEGGEQLMAQEMFDGFDHTRYQDEVQARWGQEAYAVDDAPRRHRRRPKDCLWPGLRTRPYRNRAPRWRTSGSWLIREPIRVPMATASTAEPAVMRS
jgi:DNA-binding transcriptional MerR regulator